METLRMFGMALLAVLMCVNFASCSSDDNDEPIREKKGTFVVGKNLIEVRDNNWCYGFNYDEQGRVIKYSEDSETYTYTYSNKEVVKKAKNKDVTFTYTLDNNVISELKRIQHYSYGTDTITAKYFYTNNAISRIEVKQRNNFSNVTNPALYQDKFYYYTWSDENISIRKLITNSQYDSYTCYMHYTTTPCHFTLGQFCGFPDATYVDIYLLWEGYYGKKPKNVVKFEEKIHYDNYKEVINHEYEFDKDDYITRGSYETNYGGSSSTQILNIKWK